MASTAVGSVGMGNAGGDVCTGGEGTFASGRDSRGKKSMQ